jgi:hypothetical protein
MNASHFMHYDPLKIVNILESTSVHRFLQKCGLLHKVDCQWHLNGSEQYQRTVGCGLMDHNKYLIGNVGFMSWNSWPNMSTTCIKTMHPTSRCSYPYPTHISFCCNWVQDYLHPESCNCLLVASDTNLVFKGWCNCNAFDSSECNIIDFTNTSWVVDLRDVTNGGGSTSI